MARFDYARAVSLDHAVSLINDPAYKSRLLSGGTDLQVYLHQHPADFDRVVDISLLPELKIIQSSGAEITLGAGVTFTEVIECALLQDTVPFLAEACRAVGSPQIRNLGTMGGNVVNAAACADTLPVLVCLDAVAHLKGPRGERDLLVAELVSGPNITQIGPGELLTHFTFEIPPERSKTVFIKLGRRNALAISRLSIAAMGRLDGRGQVDFVRITPGAATPQTVRLKRIEAMLLGKPLTSELIHSAALQAADEMVAQAGRRWSSEYKSPVISCLAERALAQVLSSDPSPAARNGPAI
ncbi:MAG: FAD binding domain-containing protein [Anaerolineales bacterium]|jgi:CO/xanthine dehydrogenase FAD-binding subunit